MIRSSHAGCSSTVPFFILSSSSSGVLTLYLVSMSWTSARTALRLALRYSFTPPVTSVSGETPRDLETLSISSLVSVMFVTVCACVVLIVSPMVFIVLDLGLWLVIDAIGEC